MTLAVLGASALACAPSVSAKTVVTIGVGRTTVAGQGNSGSALASCPKGLQAVAGGYSQSPAAGFGTSSLLDVSDSFRQSKKSWTVTGTQVAGGSGTLTAYVYCQAGLPKIKTKVVTEPLGAAARSEATVTAPCPGNSKLLSGGFRKPPFSGGSFVFLSDNERATPTSWTVTAVRASAPSASQGTVYAVAYCLPGARVKSTLKTSDLPVSAAPGAPTAVAAPKCKGTTAYAGGTRSPYVTGGTDRGAFLVTDALLLKKKWQVSGLSFGGPGAIGLPVKVSAINYCR